MKTYDSFQKGDGRLRKQFERFYQRTWSHPIDKDREWKKRATAGNYFHSHVQSHWITWQAAVSHTRRKKP